MAEPAAPLSNADIIIGRITELQVALQTRAPNYESLLHIIHVSLAKDENVVHLLTEEQIGIVCAGLSTKTNVVIAAVETKKGTRKLSNGKKLSDVSIENDL